MLNIIGDSFGRLICRSWVVSFLAASANRPCKGHTSGKIYLVWAVFSCCRLGRFVASITGNLRPLRLARRGRKN
ncbi:hypothetical protein PXK30_21985 [Phaeobacter gallaeciensis]|uniref:hypothetical protein n=1 Tax=Phaeobacter gallaeciensis TaxID=60890 RepID=UPI00237F518D|nr:hypothetical protein [Phaeobacter gallaeciensis]MDE4306312.1 hypothetical protein [Phaeobacter gallaeciensis]MDE4333092.1 hypothetical protein [Phaeobacter gallaeciensis]MDE4337554.1 hypothetical protein [Phaeobacter gallaeciensis]MDE4355405.1 hypothetical protein [Phaeobacter gallaeciensis]MDE4364278.1 hypothetical protein [Phaeobacter gallaeciensis]